MAVARRGLAQVPGKDEKLGVAKGQILLDRSALLWFIIQLKGRKKMSNFFFFYFYFRKGRP